MPGEGEVAAVSFAAATQGEPVSSKPRRSSEVKGGNFTYFPAAENRSWKHCTFRCVGKRNGKKDGGSSPWLLSR